MRKQKVPKGTKVRGSIAPPRQGSVATKRLGRPSAGHLNALQALCCSGPSAVRFPDGSDLPSIPYQTRDQTTFRGSPASANAFGINIQPDDPDATYRLAEFNSAGVLVGYAPNTLKNPSFDGTSVAQVRLISACVRVSYVGASLSDAGVIMVKGNGPDWSGMDVAPFYGLPSATGSAAVIDKRYPYREGFDYMFLPEDPRSRTYAPYPRPPVPADPAIREVFFREFDKWSNMTFFVQGAQAAQDCMFELTCNWEIIPKSGSILSRVAPIPAPLNSKALDTLSKVQTAVLKGPGPVASRAQTNPLGGLASFLATQLSAHGPELAAMAGRALGRAAGAFAADLRTSSMPVAKGAAFESGLDFAADFLLI